MCLNPIKAISYIFTSELTGEQIRQFKLVSNCSPTQIYNLQKYYNTYPYEGVILVDLPCGKCFECLQTRANEWSYRLMNEASLYDKSCFVTLTYAETDGQLNKRDYQLFLKRLRRHLDPLKIRYFLCGEYGSKGHRPHYHLIIFGWSPDDLELLYVDKKSGDKIYKSEFLAKIWQKGFISVGQLSINSCRYVAKYLQKLNDLNDKKIKPFLAMSMKPGIGYQFFDTNYEKILSSDKIYCEGNWIKTPRYYLKLAERKGIDLNDIKQNRVVKADLLKKSDEELDEKRKKIDSFLKKVI